MYLTVIFTVTLTADPETIKKLKAALLSGAIAFLIMLLVLCFMAFGPLVAMDGAKLLAVINATINYGLAAQTSLH